MPSKPFLLQFFLIFCILFGPHPLHAEKAQRTPQNPWAREERGRLFVTGSERIEVIGGRRDKAREFAQKRAFSMALRLLHIEADCPGLLSGIKEGELKGLLRVVAPGLSKRHLKGLLIQKKWCKGGKCKVTVSIPLDEIKDGGLCPYSDIKEAVDQYLSSGGQDLDGLLFSLKRVEPYSSKEALVKKRIGEAFDEMGQYLQKMPFVLQKSHQLPSYSLIALSMRFREERAKRLVLKAEALSRRGAWEEALLLLEKALKLDGHSPEGYELLGDYFLSVENEPALSLYAYKKALRPGIFAPLLAQKIARCENILGRGDEELWEYLAKKTGDSGIPEWEEEMDVLSDLTVAPLVLMSLGEALEGGEAPSVPLEFKKAKALYKEAATDEDLIKTLSVLFAVSERHPYNAGLWNLAGACYRNLGRPLVAIPFLLQALKLRPGYDLALSNLALCCKDLGLLHAAHFYAGLEGMRKSQKRWVKDVRTKILE